jgi:biopolymer transport protein ExbD
MRSHRQKRSYGLPLNMTPLIDVVFLLLVFFLVASQFAQVEYEQEVDLPEAESGEQAPQARRRLVVHVGRDESLSVAGLAVDPDALEQRLRDFLGGDSPDDVEVRLRADRAVPYRAIEPVLLACARSGIWRVDFAVLHESASER